LKSLENGQSYPFFFYRSMFSNAPTAYHLTPIGIGE